MVEIIRVFSWGWGLTGKGRLRLKHLPGMRETRAQSLGREDPLEKEMAPHSSTLAWRIPWREEPGRLQSMGRKESDTTERLHLCTLDSCSIPFGKYLVYSGTAPSSSSPCCRKISTSFLTNDYYNFKII